MTLLLQWQSPQTLPGCNYKKTPDSVQLAQAKIVELNSRVQLGISTISSAGFGVFATKTIKPWQYICKYGGIVYRNVQEKEFEKLLGESDAAYYSPSYRAGVIGSKTMYGPMINDPRDDSRVNCRIEYHNKQFRIIALESEIEPGEELFHAYGEDYWRKFDKKSRT